MPGARRRALQPAVRRPRRRHARDREARNWQSDVRGGNRTGCRRAAVASVSGLQTVGADRAGLVGAASLAHRAQPDGAQLLGHPNGSRRRPGRPCDDGWRLDGTQRDRAHPAPEWCRPAADRAAYLGRGEAGALASPVRGAARNSIDRPRLSADGLSRRVDRDRTRSRSSEVRRRVVESR